MLKICDIKTINSLIDNIQNIDDLTIYTHTDGKVYSEFTLTDVELSNKECVVELLSKLQDVKEGMETNTIVNFSFKYNYKENLAIGNVTYKRTDEIESLKQTLDKVLNLFEDKKIDLDLWKKENKPSSDSSAKKKNTQVKKLTTTNIFNMLKEGLDKCQE